MSEERPIRAGIVGAGLMGRWHAHAVRRTGGRVVGVADPDGAAAARVARADRAAVFASCAEMLDAVELDVVHLCVPLELHVPLAEAALERRIAVLVEKPLAAGPDPVRALADRAAAAGVPLCPVHQFPFQRGFRRARAASGSLGPLVHVEATICSAGAEGRDEAGLRAFVAEMLPHPLSVVRAATGRPLADVAWETASNRAGDLRVQGRVGDALVGILLSSAGRPTENSLRLRHEGGTVEVDFFHGYAVRLPGAVSRGRKVLLPFERAARHLAAAGANLAGRAVRREPAYPGLRRLVRELHGAVRTGGPGPIPPEEVVDLELARARILGGG